MPKDFTEQEKAELTIQVMGRLNACVKILTNAIENRNTALAVYACYKLHTYVDDSDEGKAPIPMLITLIDMDSGNTGRRIIADDILGVGVIKEYHEEMHRLAPTAPSWMRPIGDEI